MAKQAVPPMRLQIMSDLHLETPRMLPMYSSFHIEPKCSYLCLLGDIGNVHDSRLFEFLKSQLQSFHTVFYLLGNHEPYAADGALHDQSCTRAAAEATLEDFRKSMRLERDAEIAQFGTSSMGVFEFMNRTRVDLSDTLTILGCTLFSSVVEDQRSTVSLFVSDFSNIAEWTVDAHNKAHQLDLDWLNREVTSISQHEPHRHIVILTHHSPTTLAEANDPDHSEDNRNVRSAFATDLSTEPCWTDPIVRLWAFGHTHFNCDFVDVKRGKRLVANQRGYGREDIFDFDPGKIVSVS